MASSTTRKRWAGGKGDVLLDRGHLATQGDYLPAKLAHAVLRILLRVLRLHALSQEYPPLLVEGVDAVGLLEGLELSFRVLESLAVVYKLLGEEGRLGVGIDLEVLLPEQVYEGVDRLGADLWVRMLEGDLDYVRLANRLDYQALPEPVDRRVRLGDTGEGGELGIDVRKPYGRDHLAYDVVVH